MVEGVSHKKMLRLKNTFAKNVASMHNEEIFGVPSGGISWECLIKDFLILTTLCCHTGEVLSQMDINCLSGKVTNDCNC